MKVSRRKMGVENSIKLQRRDPSPCKRKEDQTHGKR